MKKIDFSTATHNLIKNTVLLLSTGAALCHYIATSIVSVLMLGCIFASVCVAAMYGKTKPEPTSNRYLKFVTVVLAIMLSAIGYEIFNTTWELSGKVRSLAELFGLTKPQFLMIVSLIGCVAGFYAIYVLSCHIVNIVIKFLKNKLPVKDKQAVSNLKRNWYFPISALAFFGLGTNFTVAHFASMLIALLVSVIIASQIDSVWDSLKSSPRGMKIYSVFTAIGICIGMLFSFYINLLSKIPYISSSVINVLGYFGLFLSAAGVFFAYFCVSFFCKEMKRIFSETGLFKGIKAFEYTVYAVVILALLYLVVFSFSQTDAFYGTNYEFDIIYTSDSPKLVKQNVYLSLNHSENDLRQPLFAVYASPFLGIPYFISAFLNADFPLRAMLLNSVQVIMLVVSNFILARAMKLDAVKRICFVLLASCTYTSLLFSLMMEQYIVAYFWLAFCVYLICEKKRPDRIALYGAGGTLITSMVLMLSMSDKSPYKRFKEWFADMVKYGIEFVLLLLALSRFDVIMNLTTKASSLSGFTEVKLTVADKLYQYTEFIFNLFLPPNAGESFAIEEHISWQLNEITAIDLIGVGMLLLAVVSAIVNREKISSRIAIGWVGFSFILLVGLGWGTAENGLILYALYFGWAFLTLIFQLAEKLESKLKVRFILPVLSVAAAVFMAYNNIPAIMEMIDFAITNFPV